MKSVTAWMLVNKRGNPVLLSRHLPIFWLKSMAQWENVVAFNGEGIVKKVRITEIKKARKK